MMGEMEERVAKVFEDALRDYANGKVDTLASARAAIAAMKEPAYPGIPVYRFPDGTPDVLAD